MNNELIQEIAQFCEKKTQQLIAQLEKVRFDQQGEFNGHQRWSDNAKDVIKDKGRNHPLVDTGRLEHQLATPENWNLTPLFANNTLKLSVPERESFTDSKYDKLDKGGHSPAYVSPRGNKMRGRNLPARPFKDLSEQDAEWITDKLAQAIEEQFG